MAQQEYPWQNVEGGKRGAFIVVEGLDRAGKTTQVKMLCDALHAAGHNIKTLRFPDRTTTIGAMISSYLASTTEMDDHAIHLLFSANRWEKAAYIRSTIAEGYTIVCDRYVYSGMIYSAAKGNPKLGLAWAKSPDVGLPLPDLVVFLDLKPEDAERRGGWGEEKYEKKEMQMRVRELFLEVSQKEDVMVTIDAGPPIEDVSKKVLTVCLTRLGEHLQPEMQMYH